MQQNTKALLKRIDNLLLVLANKTALFKLNNLKFAPNQ